MVVVLVVPVVVMREERVVVERLRGTRQADQRAAQEVLLPDLAQLYLEI
jgi:hypothetical protein